VVPDTNKTQVVSEVMDFMVALREMDTLERWSKLFHRWVKLTYPNRYRWDSEIVSNHAIDIVHTPVKFWRNLNPFEREMFVAAAQKFAEEQRVEEEEAAA